MAFIQNFTHFSTRAFPHLKNSAISPLLPSTSASTFVARNQARFTAFNASSQLHYHTKRNKSTVFMEHTILVPIADGSEEIEAVTIIDTLVRAGAKVVVASVMDKLQVTASRGVKLVADVLIKDVADKEFDVILLPGGMPGSEHLRDSAPLKQMLLAQNQRQGKIGAICAAPAVVLAHHGLLKGHEATCYPADHFLEKLDIVVNEEQYPVVISRNITTSKGPGTAMVFSLAMVEQLFGSAKALELAAVMLLDMNENWTYDTMTDREAMGAEERTVDV